MADILRLHGVSGLSTAALSKYVALDQSLHPQVEELGSTSALVSVSDILVHGMHKLLQSAYSAVQYLA